MSDFEKQVWASAYGAAFAQQLSELRPIAGFDRAVKHCTAEEPGTIADLAVGALRKWQANECSSMGHDVTA